MRLKQQTYYSLLPLILRPLGMVLAWVFYPLNWVLARWGEKRFINEIRKGASCLFDGGAVIIPSPVVEPDGVYFVVTVSTGALLIRFWSGRGDLDIALTSKDGPQKWRPLRVVISELDHNEALLKHNYTLPEAAAAICGSIRRIEDAL